MTAQFEICPKCIVKFLQKLTSALLDAPMTDDEICAACRGKLRRKLAVALGIDLDGKFHWQREKKPLWVNSREAARLLSVSTATLYHMRQRGQIRCKQIDPKAKSPTWLYLYADLERND